MNRLTVIRRLIVLSVSSLIFCSNYAMANPFGVPEVIFADKSDLVVVCEGTGLDFWYAYENDTTKVGQVGIEDNNAYDMDIAALNFDGDRHSEFVISYTRSNGRWGWQIRDDKDHNFVTLQNSMQAEHVREVQVCGADIDGDNKDAVVAVGRNAGNSNYPILRTSETTGWNGDVKIRDIGVAAGDFNGNGKESVVIAGRKDGTDDMAFYVLTYNTNGWWDSDYRMVSESIKQFGNDNEVQVTCGDFDGDLQDEFAIVYNDYHNGNYYTWLRVYEWNGSGYDCTTSTSIGRSSSRIAVKSGDVDGDLRDEIVTHWRDHWPTNTSTGQAFLKIFDIQGDQLYSCINTPDTSITNDGGDIAVADLDMDGKAEIYQMYRNNSSNYKLRKYWHTGSGFTYTTFANTWNYKHAYIAAPNFDGDGLVGKYKSFESITKYTPAFYMAMTPYKTLSGEDNTGNTVYGKWIIHDEGDKNESATAVSVSVSYGSSGLSPWDFGMKTTVRKTTGKSTSTHKTEMEIDSYDCAGGDNCVVASEAEFLRYKYKVLQPSNVKDEFIYYNGPVDVSLVPFSATDWDNSMGINASYHADQVFANTVGDPESYMADFPVDEEDIELCGGWKMTGATHGACPSEAAYSITHQDSFSNSRSVQQSVNAGIEGNGVEFGVSTEESYTHWVATGNRMHIKGNNNGFRNYDLYTKWKFKHQTFLYNSYINDKFPIVVIDHLVDLRGTKY